MALKPPSPIALLHPGLGQTITMATNILSGDTCTYPMPTCSVAHGCGVVIYMPLDWHSTQTALKPFMHKHTSCLNVPVFNCLAHKTGIIEPPPQKKTHLYSLVRINTPDWKAKAQKEVAGKPGANARPRYPLPRVSIAGPVVSRWEG